MKHGKQWGYLTIITFLVGTNIFSFVQCHKFKKIVLSLEVQEKQNLEYQNSTSENIRNARDVATRVSERLNNELQRFDYEFAEKNKMVTGLEQQRGVYLSGGNVNTQILANTLILDKQIIEANHDTVYAYVNHVERLLDEFDNLLRLFDMDRKK